MTRSLDTDPRPLESEEGSAIGMKRRRLRYSLTASLCAGIIVGLAGCIPFMEEMGGAGIVVVNESDHDLRFHQNGVTFELPADRELTLWFRSADDHPDCTEDIRVVTEDGTAELWRDEICEDETWVIRAEDLEPVAP